MSSADELEPTLLEEYSLETKETATEESKSKVLGKTLKTISTVMLNMDSSITRLQFNDDWDTPGAQGGPRKKRRVAQQPKVEKDGDSSDAEGLRLLRSNKPDAD